MKKFLTRRLLPLMGVLVLCIAMMTTAFATDVPYTPVAGGSTSFQEALILESDANVPTMTFTYELVPGTAVAAAPGTKMEIISPSAAKGVTGAPTVGSAVYAPGDATVTTAEGVTIAAGEKAALKTVAIDFTGVTFAEPGIYRYLLNATAADQQGVSYDIQKGNEAVAKQRVLDVYVIDNAGSLNVAEYVLHELASDIAPGDDYGSQHDPVQLQDKSLGFVESYKTVNMSLSKTVSGNQGSRDKYFAFQVAITNAGASNALDVIWTDAVDALNAVKSPATIYEQDAMRTANGADDNATIEGYQWVTDASGAVTKTVYLKHGQSIEIKGLAAGAKYTITESPEDYKPSYIRTKVGADNGQNIVGQAVEEAAAADNDGLQFDQLVDFTNTRNGVVPTGIAASLIPGLALMGSAGVGIFALTRKKKDEE